MPQRRQLSVSRSNLIWFAIVLVAAALGAMAGGWKLALVFAAIALVASEIVERTARSRRANRPGGG